jgi:ABC-type nitrate/sulfonate/bicarbonate transport system permease component
MRRLFVAVIIIAILGLALNYLLEQFEKRALIWKEEASAG